MASGSGWRVNQRSWGTTLLWTVQLGGYSELMAIARQTILFWMVMMAINISVGKLSEGSSSLIFVWCRMEGWR